jgi:hypothetical protein
VESSSDEPSCHFSVQLGDTFHKEKQAVEDISLLAGVGDYHDLKCPSVVYLIRARRDELAPDSSVFGFDVYEVRPGNRTPDNPTVTHDVVGGNEDAHIVVTRPDMGLQAGGDPFSTRLHQLRQYLDQDSGGEPGVVLCAISTQSM